MSENQDFLWHVHEYVNEYIRFGDAKAAFAGTFASGLLAVLYSSRAHAEALQVPCRQWSVATWLAVPASVFLAASVVLALLTVRPRLRSSQSKGFIFWGNIAAHRKVDVFQASFHSQSEEALNDQLLHHLFDLSQKVCLPKYRQISLSIATLGIGGLLAGAALALQAAPEAPSAPVTVQAGTAAAPLPSGKPKGAAQGPAVPHHP